MTPVSGKPEPHPSGYYHDGGYDGGGELCGDSSRTLAIYYPPRENVILIQGTIMIPEFDSSISELLATLGIVGAIVASIATRRKTL
jgi:hypothetical protein